MWENRNFPYYINKDNYLYLRELTKKFILHWCRFYRKIETLKEANARVWEAHSFIRDLVQTKQLLLENKIKIPRLHSLGILVCTVKKQTSNEGTKKETVLPSLMVEETIHSIIWKFLEGIFQI